MMYFLSYLQNQHSERTETHRLSCLDMTGRMREARNDFIGAYEAYKKAMEYNPNSIEIYRVLIRLASGLDKTEEAIKYAQKAVELDPEDYELMRKLGLHMAGQGRYEEAVTFLKKASNSPSIDKKSGVYVIIQHDQANLYERLGKKKKRLSVGKWSLML